jgi:hypothetical protein
VNVSGLLITISALTGADRPAAGWAALLLAIAPAPLAAITAFVPDSLAKPMAVVTTLVLIAGIAGAFAHIGLIVLQAVVVMAVAAVLLWRR